MIDLLIYLALILFGVAVGLGGMWLYFRFRMAQLQKAIAKQSELIFDCKDDEGFVIK